MRDERKKKKNNKKYFNILHQRQMFWPDHAFGRQYDLLLNHLQTEQRTEDLNVCVCQKHGGGTTKTKKEKKKKQRQRKTKVPFIKTLSVTSYDGASPLPNSTDEPIATDKRL